MGQANDADEILASALLEDAAAHEAGEFDRIADRYDDVLNEVLPIEGPDPRRFAIAFDFWDSWGGARNREWPHDPEIDRSEWPVLARHIAGQLRAGEIATDPRVVARFGPENRVGCLAGPWRRLPSRVTESS